MLPFNMDGVPGISFPGIPGLPMTVVQADGQNVKPVETDELRITQRLVLQPRAEIGFAF